ncbi:hypothetical protein GCM10027214_25600 [Stenotrophomonas tumulicola]
MNPETALTESPISTQTRGGFNVLRGIPHEYGIMMMPSRIIHHLAGACVAAIMGSSAHAQHCPPDPWGGEVACREQGPLACYRYALDRIPKNVGYFEATRMLGYGDRIIGVLTDMPGASGKVRLTGHTVTGEKATLYLRRGAAPTADEFDCSMNLAEDSPPPCEYQRGGEEIHFMVEAGNLPARVYLYGFVD